MWYVMQVYTGKELEIAQQCRERVADEGEDVFVPLAERWTKIRGERTLITSRLFPGYVFIETEGIEDFYKRLNRIYAMTKVLRTGDEMMPIQKEEEEYLRKLGGDEHVVKYSEGYIEGERLIVTSGPLKDFAGNVKKVLRHKRLVVMEVPLLGRTVEVTVGMGVVERREEVAESI